ncbi:MAG: ribosome biogenesis GTPase YlqF [Oscillospiraceae bacterium]|nr:ribosome biogenesis GTPase YlqF [Oscillospiraceae bacterium]
MTDNINIQWFPGHMAKAKRIIQKNLSLVDIIIEILDARAPKSSSSFDLDKIINQKPRLILLNKSDLADPVVTKNWANYYKNINIKSCIVDSRASKGLEKVVVVIKEILKDEIQKRINKGMIGRPIRAMIVGTPNVGKSSFINRMAKQKKARVEDRPGVTRGKQWISTDFGLEFLDMPGVLSPKFEEKEVGENLAFLGSVNDNILDLENLSIRLLEFLYSSYKNYLFNRYKIIETQIDWEDSLGLLKIIAKNRGMFISGGELDLERASITVLDEFRSGKIGRISLESPK